MANMKPQTSKLKAVILVLIVALLGTIGYLVYGQYQKTAPQRVSVAFFDDIANNGNINAAYNLTSNDFRSTTSLTKFAQVVNPLYKSGIKFTETNTGLVKGYALDEGVLEDLRGANYQYTMVLQKNSANWQIKSLVINKQ